MAGFKTLFAKLGFTDGDETDEETLHDSEADEEEEEEYEDEEEEEGGFRMPSWFSSVFSRSKARDDDEGEEEEEEQEEPEPAPSAKAGKSGRVIDYKKSKERNAESRAYRGEADDESRHNEYIYVVRSLGDSRAIIMHLHAGNSVILNLESIDPKDCGRVIDLLSGAAFALGGSITKVSRLTYLLAPNDITVVPPQQSASTRFTL